MTRGKAKEAAAAAVEEPAVAQEQPQALPTVETSDGPQTVLRPMTREQLQQRVQIVNTVGPTPKPTKVAILGFVKHFAAAPFNDPEWEIWGLNELYDHIPRWTRWFELHARELYEQDRNRTSQHIQKLKAMTCPVYMHKHWDDIPGSVEYPAAAIANIFPNPCPEARPYWTNSITYMILLAVAEGFKEIGIWGVDMAHDTEYSAQRPSCEWAVGIAQGRGIKVYLPAESDLLKTLFLYGYEAGQATAFDKKLASRVGDYQNNLNNLDNEIARLSEVRAQYRGALQDLQHWQKNWKTGYTPPAPSSS